MYNAKVHAVESVATTQQHLHLSRWDHLEHCRTSCDGRTLSINKERAVALRSDKHALKTKWGRSDSDVGSPTAPEAHESYVSA